MVRYKTTQEQSDANQTLIRAVFSELRSTGPGGIRYASYRLADGVTFVHIATLDAADNNPFTALPAFKAFQERIKERCVELPVVAEMTLVDSYGF